ncbi:MAG: hypothetical protein WA815_19025 [Terracidiphilus sp.]
MPSIRQFCLFLLVFLSAAPLAQQVNAATAPADPCSLLSPAVVSSTLGDPFGAPQKSVAPRPFPNTVQGTDCRYATSNGRHELLFRVYFDHSTAEATDLHAKLKMYFGAGSTPAVVGDEAYFDGNHSLHARKGNVRFFLSDGNDEKKLTALGNIVAGQL